MVADKVEVGRNISFLQPSIKDPEAMANKLRSKLVLVIKISEDIGNVLQLGSPKTADIADLVEYFS
jgi:hypothetical protein